MKIYPVPQLFDGRIALSPCPQGGEKLASEIASLKQQGYRLVVSMLTPEEQEKHQLIQEQNLCEAQEIGYLNYPIRDEVADSDEETLTFVQQLKQQINTLSGTDKILFHCRGGVGRSSMMIALLMVSEGLNVDDVFAQLSKARGETTPESLEQRQWVKTLDNRLYSRVAKFSVQDALSKAVQRVRQDGATP